MPTLNLRGHPTAHYSPTNSERFNAADETAAAAVRQRVEHLNTLSDDAFAGLPEYFVQAALDPREATEFPDWLAWLKHYLPVEVPVPDAPEIRVLDRAAEPGEWPILSILPPWEVLVVDSRNDITLDHVSGTARERRPRDSFAQVVISFDRPRPGWDSPHFDLGWWPADGGPPQLMRTVGISIPGTGYIPCFYVPPRPAEVRIRVANWVLDQSGRKGIGAWSEPTEIARVHAWRDGRRAWSKTDFRSAARRFEAGGKEWAWADLNHAPARIPIEAIGDVNWQMDERINAGMTPLVDKSGLPEPLPVPRSEPEPEPDLDPPPPELDPDPEPAPKPEVTIAPEPAAAAEAENKHQRLIEKIEGYCAEQDEAAPHVQRWRAALAGLGVENGHLPMSAAQAASYRDRGWDRWIEVVKALREVERTR